MILEFKFFEPVRYYISTGNVSCILYLNSILIVGTREGTLNFFDTRENDFQHKKNRNKYIDFMYDTLEEDQEYELEYSIRLIILIKH